MDINEVHVDILGGGFFCFPFVHVDKGGGGCKMSTLVHSRGGGGQNWSKFGPRSWWMTPSIVALQSCIFLLDSYQNAPLAHYIGTHIPEGTPFELLLFILCSGGMVLRCFELCPIWLET